MSFKCGPDVFICGLNQDDAICAEQFANTRQNGNFFVIPEDDPDYDAFCKPMCNVTTLDAFDVIGDEQRCPCVNGNGRSVSNWVCYDSGTFIDGQPVKYQAESSELCTYEVKDPSFFGNFSDLEPFDFASNTCPSTARFLRGGAHRVG